MSVMLGMCEEICFHVAKCLQEGSSVFSLCGALFDVLVDNKEQFVSLFIKKVDLKRFLDNVRLNDLYNQVYIIRFTLQT